MCTRILIAPGTRNSGGIRTTPAAALQAATIHNARVLHAEKNLGSIEPGKLADILMLDADPVASIQNSRKIAVVIKGGRVLDPKSLLHAARDK